MTKHIILHLSLDEPVIGGELNEIAYHKRKDMIINWSSIYLRM